MIKFVYFDVGGVLIKDLMSGGGWEKMKKEWGVKQNNDEEFEKYFNKYEIKVCTGIKLNSIIPRLEKRFGLTFPPGYDMQKDMISRFKRNDDVWSIVDKVKEAKINLGLLTNMYPGMLDELYEKNLIKRNYWNVVIDSSIEGVQKPDQNIFKLAEAKSGFSGNDILYIDNTNRYLKVAECLGWKTFLYDPTNYDKSNRTLDVYLNKFVQE
jgi:FMN phosphatase YigB (HAD superfamily)